MSIDDGFWNYPGPTPTPPPPPTSGAGKAIVTNAENDFSVTGEDVTGTFTGPDNGTWTAAGISGTNLNDSPVGQTTPEAGTFTNLTARASLTVGVGGTTQGFVVLEGSTSGAAELTGPASGGGTMTLQAGTDILVGRQTTDILTNKTLANATLTGTATAPDTGTWSGTGIAGTNVNNTPIGLTTPEQVTTNYLQVDTGTKTAAANGSGDATLNKMAGVITTASLTTASGAQYTLTLSNIDIAAADQVFASVQYGSATTGTPAITTVAPAFEQVTIIVQNIHATAALNGTLNIAFLVVKN